MINTELWVLRVPQNGTERPEWCWVHSVFTAARAYCHTPAGFLTKHKDNNTTCRVCRKKAYKLLLSNSVVVQQLHKLHDTL